MDSISGDLVIRAWWPGTEGSDPRPSYGMPIIVGASGILLSVIAYVMLGSPLGDQPALIPGAASLLTFALFAAYRYDGTALIVNRETIVLTKWLHRPTTLVVGDLARIVRCSVEVDAGRTGYSWRPAVFFFNREGRCVMSLYDRFRDQDLAQLWTKVGITPEGNWSDQISLFDLKRRFPGAFDKAA